jgi:hypothetical protein
MLIRQFNSLSKNRITALICLLLIGIPFLVLKNNSIIESMGVPLGYLIFNDTRVITAGAESFHQGYDPLVENPAMPTKNAMNYPRIWHSLFFLGLNQEHTLAFGITLTILYLIGLLILIRVTRGIFGQFLILICAISPASILAMERGNIDLVIFFLISLVFILKRRYSIFSSMVLTLSIFLKLFPIFCAPVLLIGRRKTSSLWIFLAVIAISLVYFYCIRSDLALISLGTPRADDLSYGKNVVFDAFFPRTYTSIWVAFTVASAIVMAFIIGHLTAKVDVIANGNLTCFQFFAASCLIYAGTFLIGNNWDYRLIFLIFSLPYLSSLNKSNCNKHILYLARLFVLCIFLSMWYLFIKNYLTYTPFIGRLILLFDELVNWATFILSIVFLIKILPFCISNSLSWLKFYR